MKKEGQEFLNVREAATFLGISSGGLYRAAARGIIPSYDVPGVGIRFSSAVLREFIYDHRKIDKAREEKDGKG